MSCENSRLVAGRDGPGFHTAWQDASPHAEDRSKLYAMTDEYLNRSIDYGRSNVWAAMRSTVRLLKMGAARAPAASGHKRV